MTNKGLLCLYGDSSPFHSGWANKYTVKKIITEGEYQTQNKIHRNIDINIITFKSLITASLVFIFRLKHLYILSKNLTYSLYKTASVSFTLIIRR